MEKIQLPQNVEYIINKIKKQGFEAYIVGGCVRDSLMGKVPNDWDITTSAPPSEVKNIFRHTIDTGIKHGTVTVVKNGTNYEVTTYRTDGEYEDCRHPKNVTFTRDLHEDLLRRDFTVNAIAYGPSEGFVDIFGGIYDIEKKIIRGVGEAGQRFREDALRMLRAVRFSVQLDFDIEKETFDAIGENGSLIKKISAERIREELTKTLLGKHVNRISSLWETGLLKHIDPHIHNSLVQNGGLAAKYVSGLDSNTAAAFAIFLRWAEKEKAIHFVKGLKFDTKTYNLIVKLIENAKSDITCDETAVRQMASKLGAQDCAVFLKTEASCGRKEAFEASKILEGILERKEPLTVKELNITGADIMAMGIGEGKKVGETLSYLLGEVLKEPSKNDFETLKHMAEQKIWK
ncbi:MAG: CCA tRNA nucleotidyltransferase [Firmicutes bacterium]|nr:CCA tRNA nucleotidyltransferase [Bacillota bacterium]